jgi:hypothetical protein
LYHSISVPQDKAAMMNGRLCAAEAASLSIPGVVVDMVVSLFGVARIGLSNRFR